MFGKSVHGIDTRVKMIGKNCNNLIGTCWFTNYEVHNAVLFRAVLV